MSALNELYQELIIDHGRHPRNFRKLKNPSAIKQGYNALCVDKIKIYIINKQGIIEDISFDGEGCAISMASASLMTEALKGKSIEYASQLFRDFQHCVMGKACKTKFLGKLASLAGVREFPMRVKCATLPWHTMHAILKNKAGSGSSK